MKLSFLLVASVIETKRLRTPPEQLEKVKKHITTVWDTWFQTCKTDSQKNRYDNFIDMIEEKYDFSDCTFFDTSVPNGGPEPSRKRRDEDAAADGGLSDYWDDVGDSSLEPRLSANKDRAIRQIGKLVTLIGTRYMVKCSQGRYPESIERRAKKRTQKLRCMKCGGAAGCFEE